MHIRLLGDVTVTSCAVTVGIESPRERLCLATLALWPGAIAIDDLADVVWNGRLPTNWKPSLRNSIVKLRHRLESAGCGGNSLVATTPTGYRLAGVSSVDLQAAVAAADAADEALAAGDHPEALRLAESAIVALSDELLPEVDTDWLIPHRTRAHSASVRALQIAADSSRALGRVQEAIGLAERAVGADPLREESHRQLIAALSVAGDRRAALRAYEACRQTLAHELGITPDDRTVACYREALGYAAPPAPGLRMQRDTPFVARDDDIAALNTIVAAATTVSVTGPGGIGKSRLVVEFAARAGERFEGGRYVVALEGVRNDDVVVAAVAAALGIRRAPDDGDLLDAIVADLAPRGPALLVLDGIDHVLDATARVVAAVNAGCPQAAILVTGRGPLGVSGEMVSRLGPLDEHIGARQCFRAYAGLAGTELAADERTNEAIDEVCRAVSGNPLGIELAARQTALASIADLVDRLRQESADDLVDAEVGPSDPRSDPLGLTSVIASTVDLLDDVELELFRRLAVINGPVDLQLVEATVGGTIIPARRVVRALSQLADRGLVTLDRSAVRWRYEQHAMLRATGRRLLGPEGSREAHARLATALFARLPAQATSPPPVAAIRDLVPTIRGYLSAVLAGEADMESGLRLAYWLHRYWAADGIDEGTRWLRRLLGAAGPGCAGRGSAAFGLGYLLIWAGRPDDAAGWLTTATELIDRGDPSHASAHYLLASSFENRQPALARHHYAAAVAAAEEAGLTDLALACAGGLGIVEFEAGERDRGLHRFEATLAAQEAAGQVDSMIVHLPQYAWMLISVGRFDDADRALRRAESAFGADVRIASIVTAAARARLERLRGRTDDAWRHARRAVEMITATGARRLDGLPRSTLALLELDAGRTSGALAELAEGAKSSAECEQFAALADVMDAATIVALRIGRTEHAGVLHGATNALRTRAQSVRPEPEQRELHAAITAAEGNSTVGRNDRWEQSCRHGEDLDVSELVDLVVELAAV